MLDSPWVEAALPVMPGDSCDIMNYNLLPERTASAIRVRVTDDWGRLIVTHVVSLDDAENWEAQTILSLDQTDAKAGLNSTDRTHTVLRQIV